MLTLQVNRPFHQSDARFDSAWSKRPNSFAYQRRLNKTVQGAKLKIPCVGTNGRK
jgi:hypothetical protein